MAFVGITATLALGIKATVLWITSGWSEAAPVYGLALAALALSSGIFHRYLKFLRLYGLTTLTSFGSGDSASNSTEGKPDDED